MRHGIAHELPELAYQVLLPQLLLLKFLPHAMYTEHVNFNLMVSNKLHLPYKNLVLKHLQCN